MPFVSGYLRIRGGGGHPDNELPEGEQEVDPGYGVDQGGHVDNELPRPPPGVFPPPVPSHPIVIAPPGVPPGTIWPPINPARPDNTLPGGQGGQIDNTLPGSQKFWVVVWIPGYGYKYVCVDPSLQINAGPATPPASGNRPDNELPPTSAQPKKPI
jgi:hypothetical protein